MFGISGFELLIIAVFVLIIFGPDKLPELARQFGKAMNMFKKAQAEMEGILRAEIYSAPSADEKSPVATAEGEDTVDKVAAATSAQTAWSSTEEDDEEEEEE